MTAKKRLSFSQNRHILPFLAFLFFYGFTILMPTHLQAQSAEICDNGFDDDGDGLIDCYDQDCTCTGQCDDFYYTTCNADCFYIPPCGQLSLGIQWVGEAQTGTYSTIVAGDMDKDGIPEIVTYKTEAADLYIINGATGKTKVHIVAPSIFAGGTAPAIADLDHDGFGEIVIVANDRRLYCFEHDGTIKYVSAIQVGYAGRYVFSVPNIADFDHDGWAEVNLGNQVYNGQTGALLAEGGPNVSAGEHPTRVAGGFSFNSTVAMDALPDGFCADCAGLEIVAGNQVLSVNLVTGAVLPIVSAPALYLDGFTSVADIDRDGDLDAVVQSRKNGFNTLYAWEIETSTVLREFQLLNNWQEGASRVNIADLNGDGQLEFSFVSYPYLYALRNDFTILWTLQINDASSITCSSVFDFCGDGSAEIIYRDQDKLRVLNGATGQIAWQDVCTSLTHIESPLVLDVDNDGQTEIVIECGTNGSLMEGTVVAYEAIGSPGIASRKVWNQHGYFNTNINDDLSVPRIQQNPGIVNDSLVLNTFMNQYFNPTFPSPDGRITITQQQCVGDSLEVSLQLCNTGDNLLPANTPISLYVGNPQTTPAVWIGALPIGKLIAADSCFGFTVRFPRISSDSVFFVLNDNHSKATPFNLAQDFPVTAIGECIFTDNIVGLRFYYNPATLNLGVDTAICDRTTLLLKASGNDLVSWNWQDNTSLDQLPASKPGIYSVVATDVCGITQTDTIDIRIDSSTVVSIGADQVMCAGEQVALSESGFDFYKWLPNNAVDCDNCPNVAAFPPKTGTIILEAGFNNGCMNRDTVLITVRDTFNYQVDTTVCYGRTVQWNGQTIPPDDSRSFYFQTVYGCDSIVHVRVNGTLAGTFNIPVDTAVCLGKTLPYNGFVLAPGDQKIFFLSAITGCDSTVQVNILPKDTFSTAESRVICSGASSVVFGQQYIESGIFRKTFTAKNGCDSTHTVQLTVLDPITLNLEALPTCFAEATGSLILNVLGTAPPFDYNWNLPAPNQPTLDQLPAGAYAVTVTDANECTETANTVLNAYPPIEFEAITVPVQCFGQASGEIQISSVDTSLVFGLDGLQYSQQLINKGLIAGDYAVFAQDIYGCVDTLALTVTEPPQLTLQLPADVTVALGDSIQINQLASGLTPTLYTWNNTAYLSCTNCPDPFSRPLRDIEYALTITDENGCTASDSMYITVARIIQVYVPTIFAPDGADVRNSMFSPGFGPAIYRIRRFQVYDRWGSLVHEIQDGIPNDVGASWDGSIKGKLANPGVYIWALEVELVDGVLANYQGNVTLYR